MLRLGLLPPPVARSVGVAVCCGVRCQIRAPETVGDPHRFRRREFSHGGARRSCRATIGDHARPAPAQRRVTRTGRRSRRHCHASRLGNLRVRVERDGDDRVTELFLGHLGCTPGLEREHVDRPSDVGQTHLRNVGVRNRVGKQLGEALRGDTARQTRRRTSSRCQSTLARAGCAPRAAVSRVHAIRTRSPERGSTGDDCSPSEPRSLLRSSQMVAAARPSLCCHRARCLTIENQPTHRVEAQCATHEHAARRVSHRSMRRGTVRRRRRSRPSAPSSFRSGPDC